jgi:hypothetical protein
MARYAIPLDRAFGVAMRDIQEIAKRGGRDHELALALGYRFVFGVVGCWIAARLAPYAPMRHALALGALGVLVSTAGAVAMWKAGRRGTRWPSSASRFRARGSAAGSRGGGGAFTPGQFGRPSPALQERRARR